MKGKSLSKKWIISIAVLLAVLLSVFIGMKVYADNNSYTVIVNYDPEVFTATQQTDGNGDPIVGEIRVEKANEGSVVLRLVDAQNTWEQVGDAQVDAENHRIIFTVTKEAEQELRSTKVYMNNDYNYHLYNGEGVRVSNDNYTGEINSDTTFTLGTPVRAQFSFTQDDYKMESINQDRTVITYKKQIGWDQNLNEGAGGGIFTDVFVSLVRGIVNNNVITVDETIPLSTIENWETHEPFENQFEFSLDSMSFNGYYLKVTAENPNDVAIKYNYDNVSTGYNVTTEPTIRDQEAQNNNNYYVPLTALAGGDNTNLSIYAMEDRFENITVTFENAISINDNKLTYQISNGANVENVYVELIHNYWTGENGETEIQEVQELESVGGTYQKTFYTNSGLSGYVLRLSFDENSTLPGNVTFNVNGTRARFEEDNGVENPLKVPIYNFDGNVTVTGPVTAVGNLPVEFSNLTYQGANIVPTKQDRWNSVEYQFANHRDIRVIVEEKDAEGNWHNIDFEGVNGLKLFSDEVANGKYRIYLEGIEDINAKVYVSGRDISNDFEEATYTYWYKESEESEEVEMQGTRDVYVLKAQDIVNNKVTLGIQFEYKVRVDKTDATLLNDGKTVKFQIGENEVNATFNSANSFVLRSEDVGAQNPYEYYELVITENEITDKLINITGDFDREEMEAILSEFGPYVLTTYVDGQDGKTYVKLTGLTRTFYDRETEQEIEEAYYFGTSFGFLIREKDNGEIPQIYEYDVEFINPETGAPATSWTIRGKTATATVEGKDLNNGPVVLTGDEIIKLEGFNPKTMQARVIFADPDLPENEWFTTKLNVNANGETCINEHVCDGIPFDVPIRFFVERRQSDSPEYNLPGEANVHNVPVTITSTEGHEGSFKHARVRINGFGVNIPENTNDNEYATTTNYYYDEENGDGTVNITFSTLFIDKYVGKVTVNGQEFTVSNYIDYTNRTNFLNHYGQQEVSFTVTVPKADSYNIVCDVVENPGENQWIGNFLWTDSEQAIGNDDYIGHATLEAKQIIYEIDLNNDEDYDDAGEVVTVLFDENGNFDDPNNLIEYDPYGETGSLVVPEGAECIMKITPDYRYQVTSFGVNGNNVIAQEGISEFKFFIHNGNFHLSAQVDPVADEVIPTTNILAQEGNSIVIDQNEIDSGTVRLTVGDVNNLTDEQRDLFAVNAGNNHATVTNYLDVNLDQVLYKGTADSVWNTELKDLKKPATVTLKVADDIDGDTIVILHEKHDGTYEVIPAQYNPVDHTIIFTTTSFSNYAIAAHTHTPVDRPTENVEKKATLTKDGLINISIPSVCSGCGEVLGGRGDSKPIYYPKTISLSKTSYTYDGKEKKPSVTVKDSKGKVINSSNYTVTYEKGRKNVGKYKVTVKFKGNYYEGTKNLYFTINPKGVSISSLTKKSKGFLAKWSKNTTQTTGYQIEYATDSKFKKNEKKVTISKNKTTSKTISKLKGKKKYYVRIRTYKKVNGTNYYSSWSKTKTVTTKK